MLCYLYHHCLSSFGKAAALWLTKTPYCNLSSYLCPVSSCNPASCVWHLCIMLVCGFRATFRQQESVRTADPLISMKGYLDKKKQAEDVYYGRTKEVSIIIPVINAHGHTRCISVERITHRFHTSFSCTCAASNTWLSETGVFQHNLKI